MLLTLASAGSSFSAETRPPCKVHQDSRLPFFGELHLHTRFSFDAFPWNPPLDPYGAYRFATGEEVDIPPVDDKGVRLKAKLKRRLDFTAVTDHAEGFGETGVCMNPKSSGYLSPECILYRGQASPPLDPENTYLLFGAWFYGDPLPTARTSMPLCHRPDVDCEAAAAGLWGEIRDAAETYYDRGTETIDGVEKSTCEFTTFVGYEWTGTPLGANLHRNVIFRNNVVPALPIGKTDTGPDPVELWKRLDNWKQVNCADPSADCDVVVIPHNPNLSAGQQFLDPASKEDAELQKGLEPLVEIMQVKGSSECRLGFGTNDELCNFELLSNGTFFPFPRPEQVFGPQFTERSFVRNVLKQGLRLGLPTELGLNPWQFGFVGATDSHFGTPGNVDETTHQGTHPSTANRDELINEIENNPGGLTVVWAEENSRDSIFDALQRRETYATSGTRPTVRFFGGWGDPGNICQSATFAAEGYRLGEPMGSSLRTRPPEATAPATAPWFAVSVLQDSDQSTASIQTVQVVKGWVDASGPQEKVYDVMGKKQSGTFGSPFACGDPSHTGFAECCTVWTDDEEPGFDSQAPAFWYVRVLENPTPRWSTLYCQEKGVYPLAGPSTCATQAAAAGSGFDACCATERVHPTIQERAWTSPIWYSP